MKKIKTICLLVLAFAVSGVFAETYRDAMGRTQGSSTTDRYGKTTYRDSMGRVTGTATTDRYGKTTYRDAMGRVVGTKK